MNYELNEILFDYHDLFWNCTIFFYFNTEYCIWKTADKLGQFNIVIVILAFWVAIHVWVDVHESIQMMERFKRAWRLPCDLFLKNVSTPHDTRPRIWMINVSTTCHHLFFAVGGISFSRCQYPSNLTDTEKRCPVYLLQQRHPPT